MGKVKSRKRFRNKFTRFLPNSYSENIIRSLEDLYVQLKICKELKHKIYLHDVYSKELTFRSLVCMTCKKSFFVEHTCM